MNVKLLSYNVNGIRAALKKGFADWFLQVNPDILCLQEIKATSGDVDVSFLEDNGYHHFWYSAEKKGYSGVALFTRIVPDRVSYGMGIPDYDAEGRVIRSDFGDITHLAVYFPSGTSGDVRQDFKMKFLDDFTRFVLDLRKERPNIIVSGDINIAHTEIDINNPKKHVTMSGFLPEERAWMDSFLEKGFLDTFRVFNTNPGQYSWWTYRARAREKNLGWRIDYHFITQSLRERLKSAGIHPDAFHSDHCPVSVEMEFKVG